MTDNGLDERLIEKTSANSKKVSRIIDAKSAKKRQILRDFQEAVEFVIEHEKGNVKVISIEQLMKEL